MLKSLVLLVAAAVALASSSTSVDAAKAKVAVPKSYPPVYRVDYAATKTWLETVDLDAYVKEIEGTCYVLSCIYARVEPFGVERIPRS
jgi:hypothetical protein